MAARTIGLTGANGVLGTRILQQLEERGERVVGFDGDIRSQDAVARWADGLDMIVHAAAVVPVGRVNDSPADAIAVNVGGSATVARAAAVVGARLAYISTAHVYRSSDHPIPEHAAIDPVSLYGLTKRQGEEWVTVLCPDALILRVFSYFDSRQASSFLVPALQDRVRGAEQGATLTLRGAASVRDMADATWLGRVCADMLTGDLTGAFNVAAGCAITVRELAEHLSTAMGRGDIRWAPDPSDQPNSLVADCARMQAAVRPSVFDLDGALVRFIETAAPRPASESRWS